MLTQEYVKSLLHYDPDTGIWTWKVQRSMHKAGIQAGCIKNCGHRSIKINNRKYYAHRLAWFYMTGKWPDVTDHINGIRDDNRWCNLREANDCQNRINSKKAYSNTSGYKGVSWKSKNRRWVAQILIGDSKLHLGLFDDPKEAALVYNYAAEKYFGKFAQFNEVFT